MVAPHPTLFSSLVPPALRVLARAVLLLVAATSGGCGEQGNPAPVADAAQTAATDGAATDAAATEAAAPQRGGRSTAAVTLTDEEPHASKELGALHGTILFAGEAPARFELGASSKPECEHHAEVDQRANEVLVSGGKLANVYVALDSGIDKAHVPPAPDTPVMLTQKGCMYVPRVLALRVGQPLRVSNDDPTNHNVHTRAKRNDPVNKNMGAQQAALEFRFDKAERPIPFACDIHPWMGAAVFVEEHPWFAVTDEQGAFRIRDVPPGEYVVEATHEKLGKIAGKVRVAAGKSTGFTLTLGK